MTLNQKSSRRKRSTLSWIKWPVVAICCCVTSTTLAQKIDFSHDVVPILRKHCAKCHIGDDPKGGFSLNTNATYLDTVPPSAAGKPVGASILRLISSADPEKQMPPKELPRVSRKEQQVLQQWINSGSKWTNGLKLFGSRAYEAPVVPRRVTIPVAQQGRNHPIDRILDHYLVQKKLPLTKPTDDATFIRRASLDITGQLPSPAEVNAYVLDKSPNKHVKLVDRLLADHTAYCEHWLTFWNDWLRNDYAGTGFITGGRKQISRWLYESLLYNKPYNVFARELIAPKTDEARGFADGIKWRGTVSAGQGLEIQYAQSVAQAFLGINLKCASCHDSFIDGWKLKDAYGLAAIYATSPLEIHRCDKPTGETAEPAWLFPQIGSFNPDVPQAQRLDQLARLMTSRQNGRFARTIVNRLWAQMMGRGIIHPLDAMHTQPWNEDLLDTLANYLVFKKYDLKAVIRLIGTSQAYRSRTVSPTKKNSDAGNQTYVYQGPRAKRMTAEQYMDAIWQLTESHPTQFDAPVIRGRFNSLDTESVQLSANWIWAEGEQPDAALGEQFVFRKRLDLPADVRHGVAIISVENEFELYVGKRQHAASKRWDHVKSISLAGLLKKGTNTIVVPARNLVADANKGGLFFEARLTLTNGEDLTVKSDDTWEFIIGEPANAKEGRLGKLKGEWSPAKVVKKSRAHEIIVGRQAKKEIAVSNLAKNLKVRASLLRSDFLTRSLGRPNRDQIVTSRPTELTTFEAIELANNESLAGMFKSGAVSLMQRHPGNDPNGMLQDLFLHALGRKPTANEKAVLMDVFSVERRVESVEDWFWAVCTMPEFMVVR